MIDPRAERGMGVMFFLRGRGCFLFWSVPRFRVLLGVDV